MAGLRDDQALLEQHWSYMDTFAESMIARGPTLGSDRETATGSLHVLTLPSVDAAREFVALEPNDRAGVYGEHMVWRFENLLGRTMWDFSSQRAEPLFLII
ncbi:MAG: YciI family protein, partial [Candidatus Dormiibacterota bacterium]